MISTKLEVTVSKPAPELGGAIRKILPYRFLIKDSPKNGNYSVDNENPVQPAGMKRNTKHITHPRYAYAKKKCTCTCKHADNCRTGENDSSFRQ